MKKLRQHGLAFSAENARNGIFLTAHQAFHVASKVVQEAAFLLPIAQDRRGPVFSSPDARGRKLDVLIAFERLGIGQPIAIHQKRGGETRAVRDFEELGNFYADDLKRQYASPNQDKMVELFLKDLAE